MELLLNIFTLIFDYVHKTQLHVVLFFLVLKLQNGLFADIKRLVDFIFEYSQIIFFKLLIFVKAEVRAYVLVSFRFLLLILQTFTRSRENLISDIFVGVVFISLEKSKVWQFFEKRLRDELDLQFYLSIVYFLLG